MRSTPFGLYYKVGIEKISQGQEFRLREGSR
jgi:hypothetical protein